MLTDQCMGRPQNFVDCLAYCNFGDALYTMIYAVSLSLFKRFSE